MKVDFKLSLMAFFAALAIMASIHPFWVASGMAQAAKSTPEKPETSDQFVSIDFNNVDINVFIKFMSELTGTNFVVDQRVKGKVTIISPSKISLNEAYKVFESVLEVHGYTTVQSGEIVKIVPSPDARSKSIETRLREEAADPEDKVVTQLIPLKYADPVAIKRLFTPMISKSSVILAYQPTNMMIITDVYSNIQRLFKILKQIDVPGIGQEISVIPIQYADSTKMVTL
ncbi:MAG: type II secretion system protein GspD, partial [Desulfobacterales bacterium]